jgi:hypothetical protein
MTKLTGPCPVAKHPLYRRWCFMWNVCYNPDNADYKSYGAQGIEVDPAFTEFWDFVDIVERKLGYPANLDYTWKLARKDHHGNYTIKNMAWSKSKEVGRRHDRTYILKYKGVSKPMRQWSEELGINFHTMIHRVELGWKPAQVLGYQLGPRETFLKKKYAQ